MHYTQTVYRNPYLPTKALSEVTQGCTHNQRAFCTMYKGIPFQVSKLEVIEEDLKELAAYNPDIQLIGANPLVL